MGTQPGSGTDTHTPLVGTDPQPGGFSVAEAAVALGVSVNTIRRWIKDGRLRSERVAIPTGYAYRVYTDGVPVSSTHAGMGTGAGDGSGTHAHQQASVIALETQRAEAMAAYSRALLEPLVARLSEQETIIREQAERVGRQTEQIASLDAKLAVAEEYIRALEASAPQGAQEGTQEGRRAAEVPEPSSEPSDPPAEPQPSPMPEPLPPRPNGAGWWGRITAWLMA